MLQRRPLMVEGMVLVGKMLMIVVDYVLIKKGVINGNIVSISVALEGDWNVA